MGSATGLAQATSLRAGTPNALRVGSVTAIGTSTVTVALGGGTIEAGVLSGAMTGIAVGSTVSVFKQGQSWQVQGVAAGAASGRVNGQVVAGVLRQSNGNNVTGLGVGSEVIANRQLVGTIPTGQLAQIIFRVNFSATVANGQLGMRIRDGSLAGTQYGSGHGFGPTSGFTYEAFAEAWVLGDGAQHTWVLTVQNFSSAGTMTISQSASARMLDAIVLYGPSVGVTIS